MLILTSLHTMFCFLYLLLCMYVKVTLTLHQQYMYAFDITDVHTYIICLHKYVVHLKLQLSSRECITTYIVAAASS